MKEERVRKIQTATLIVIFAALAITQFRSEPVTALLNLQEGHVKEWLNALYVAPSITA